MILTAGATASALALAPASAAENCLYELSEPEPYYVLGSLVTPQSSFIVVDSCGKSLDQVRADLAREKQARTNVSPPADAREVEVSEVQQETRVLGDRLQKERKKAILAAAEEERHWWSWLWD